MPIESTVSTDLLLTLLFLGTFLMYLIPFNLIIGGSFFIGISSLAGRSNEHHALLSKTLASLIPRVVKLTVLAFIVSVVLAAVYYNTLIPLSSILSSRSFIAALLLVIAGLYGIYFLQGRFERKKPGILLAWFIVLLFSAASMIFASNMSLMLRPEAWQIYLSGGSSGFPDWTNPALYPGFLHTLIGAIALTGLWIMNIGVRRTTDSTGWSDWAVDYGGKMFTHATFLNMAIGLWFIFALPVIDMKKYLGSSPIATHSLIMSFILTCVALIVIFKARNSENKKGLVTTGTVLMFIVIMPRVSRREHSR